MNSLSDVWSSVLQRMSTQLAPTTINTWFDEVEVVTMEDSAFVLHCGNEFKKKTLRPGFCLISGTPCGTCFQRTLR